MKTYYNSTEDTKEHIKMVEYFLRPMLSDLVERIMSHDKSKLEEPEKSIFDKFTPKLKETTYGSDEYKAFLKEMQVALKHHYENNSHHPEHYGNGINGMTLVDLIEMLADWTAATMRHDDGDIRKSIEINKERFGISDQLIQIIKNTVDKYYPWL